VLSSCCKLQSPNFTGGFPEPMETPLPMPLYLEDFEAWSSQEIEQ